MLKYLFNKTNEFYLPMLKQRTLNLFIGTFFFELFFQFYLQLERALKDLVNSGVSVPQSLMLANTLFNLTISVFFGFFLLLVVSFTAEEVRTNRKVPWLKSLNDLTWPLTRESLRAIGKILLWSFLIIPGFIWAVRYFMVTLVVILEPEVKNGKIDALKLSHFLSTNYGWKIFGFMILTTLFSTWRFQDLFKIQENPIIVILLSLAWALIQLYFALMCYFLYQYLYDIKKDSIQNFLEGEAK